MDRHFWLHNRTDPRVIEYLKTENARTEEMMRHTREFREKLYREMRARIKEDDVSVPVKRGQYLYYFRSVSGKQYDILSRRLDQPGAAEEVMVDLNQIAEGHSFCELGAYAVSPDHRYLAYSIDLTGREKYVLYFKDLVTGQMLPETIESVYYQARWANDSRTIFYSTLDPALRPYRLLSHQINMSVENDRLIYEEVDPAYRISLHKTRSEKYIFLRLESQVTTEVHFLDADCPDCEFTLVHPRQFGMEYYLLHQGDSFLILTNDKAVNFRVMETPVTAPSRKNWREIIGHRKSTMIEDAEIFRHHLVLYERRSGQLKVGIIDRRTGAKHYINFPKTVFSVKEGRNPEVDTNKFCYVYSSLVTPESVYEYDMDQRIHRLLKQDEIVGGYNPDHYRTRRIYATTADDALVPITLVYRKGIKRNGSAPLVLCGYGAYGDSVDPEFDSNRLSLLDRGIIFAIAHVRGGSELGRMWYEDGKLLQKKNSFTDFIACAEHLIAEKYTSRDRLIIEGFSAGGLLIGTVVNMRPDLFAGAIADAPFVDVVSTMQDESVPLTVSEYDEWGNPLDKTIQRYLVSYSPIDNVGQKDYPSMLIRAGYQDARVQFWEPAKWAMKLRSLKTDDNLLLLRTDMKAGHFGPSGWHDYLREVAFDYTFILDLIGLTP